MLRLWLRRHGNLLNRAAETTVTLLLFPVLWVAVHFRTSHLALRRYVSMFLVTAGAGLLAFVAISYYGTYSAQRRLLHRWQEQSTSDQVSLEHPTLSRITVPKIGLDAVIVEGTDSDSLSQGPGHLISTALPGQSGNAVIAAHRDTFFRKLYELEVGDDIFIERLGVRYHYLVVSRRVVSARDVSVLRTSSGALLTLITCYPETYIGPAPQRLVVRARLTPASQPHI